MAVASLVAIFLIFFGIRGAAADYFAGLQTRAGLERAVRLEPANPENWFSLGRYWQYNLEDPDSARAVAMYRTAAALDPRSAGVWLELATALEAEGDVPGARDAFLKAEKAYPLSAEAAWRYGNFLLRQGELDPAFAEIRRSVVSDPQRGAEAFSRCLRVEPDVEKVLDCAIPPSAGVYLEIIHELADEKQAAGALRVWDRLVGLRPAISMQDVARLMNTLRQHGQIADARRAWEQAAALAGFSELEQPAHSVVWDGGFESGVSGFGYAWYYSPNAHRVQFQLDLQERHSGKQSLRVGFDGDSNLNFSDVCHYIPVDPGTTYRFSVWAKSHELTTNEGIRFALRGLPSDANPLVTRDIRGTQPWTQVEGEWTSPPDSREAYLCLARHQSDQPDNRIRGTVWVDDVALVPVTVESRNP